MTDIQQILNDFYQIRKVGYGSKLPGKYDFKFIELAEYYSKSNKVERERIRNNIDDEIRLLIIGFSDRLATVADRTANQKLLFLALLAHSIEDFRYDERENIIRLALVNHVAIKLKVQPSELFEKVIKLSSVNGAAILRDFNNRPPELKSIRTMGIIEEQTATGVNYRYR
jgi:hypothetical protein